LKFFFFNYLLKNTRLLLYSANTTTVQGLIHFLPNSSPTNKQINYKSKKRQDGDRYLYVGKENKRFHFNSAGFWILPVILAGTQCKMMLHGCYNTTFVFRRCRRCQLLSFHCSIALSTVHECDVRPCQDDFVGAGLQVRPGNRNLTDMRTAGS